MEYKKPFLCRMGLHKRYHYLPKVGGDLGEIGIACRRCGYGQSFSGWDITPEEVQKGIREQTKIEYGRVLGFMPSSLDPLDQMQMAYDIIKDKFNATELAPIKEDLANMHKLKEKLLKGTVYKQ